MPSTKVTGANRRRYRDIAQGSANGTTGKAGRFPGSRQAMVYFGVMETKRLHGKKMIALCKYLSANLTLLSWKDECTVEG